MSTRNFDFSKSFGFSMAGQHSDHASSFARPSSRWTCRLANAWSMIRKGVFRKDHAQTKSWSEMTIRRKVVSLQVRNRPGNAVRLRGPARLARRAVILHAFIGDADAMAIHHLPALPAGEQQSGD